MQQTKLRALAMLVGLALAFTWGCAAGDKEPRLEPDTLKSWLADPQVVVLDVRSPQDWEGSNKKIKGALRRDYKDVATWAPGLPKNRRIVVYCA
jgi:rhodanese-related sulfurtransferase